MSEENGEYLVNGSPAEDALRRLDDLEWLSKALGIEGVHELRQRIEGVSRDTRFGDVHLVIAEGRITQIKVTISIKL